MVYLLQHGNTGHLMKLVRFRW